MANPHTATPSMSVQILTIATQKKDYTGEFGDVGPGGWLHAPLFLGVSGHLLINHDLRFRTFVGPLMKRADAAEARSALHGHWSSVHTGASVGVEAARGPRSNRAVRRGTTR